MSDIQPKGFWLNMVEHRPSGDRHILAVSNTGNEFNPYVDIAYGSTEADAYRTAIKHLKKFVIHLEESLKELENG